MVCFQQIHPHGEQGGGTKRGPQTNEGSSTRQGSWVGQDDRPTVSKGEGTHTGRWAIGDGGEKRAAKQPSKESSQRRRRPASEREGHAGGASMWVGTPYRDGLIGWRCSMLLRPVFCKLPRREWSSSEIRTSLVRRSVPLSDRDAGRTHTHTHASTLMSSIISIMMDGRVGSANK